MVVNVPGDLVANLRHSRTNKSDPERIRFIAEYKNSAALEIESCEKSELVVE